MFADMESDLTWKHLSTFTKPIAARLTRIREGKIFAGDAERPADEWGAATGTDTPAAAGERVNLGEEEGTAARQSERGAVSPAVTPVSSGPAAAAGRLSLIRRSTAGNPGPMAVRFLRVSRRCSPGNPPLVSIANDGEFTFQIAGLSEARTAGPSPVKAPQGGPAGPLSW